MKQQATIIFHKLSGHKVKHCLSSMQFLWLGNFFLQASYFSLHLPKRPYLRSGNQQRPSIPETFPVLCGSGQDGQKPCAVYSLGLVPGLAEEDPQDPGSDTASPQALSNTPKCQGFYFYLWDMSEPILLHEEEASCLTERIHQTAAALPTSVSETNWQKHGSKGCTFQQQTLVFQGTCQKLD